MAVIMQWVSECRNARDFWVKVCVDCWQSKARGSVNAQQPSSNFSRQLAFHCTRTHTQQLLRYVVVASPSHFVDMSCGAMGNPTSQVYTIHCHWLEFVKCNLPSYMSFSHLVDQERDEPQSTTSRSMIVNDIQMEVLQKPCVFCQFRGLLWIPRRQFWDDPPAAHFFPTCFRGSWIRYREPGTLKLSPLRRPGPHTLVGELPNPTMLT